MKKLLLLCLLLGVSIGAFAQVDTLSPITPPLRRSPFIRDMERITSSRAYRITYIGVPLVVAGLVVQERDHGFRHLRNDYVPSFRFRYDDYLQYAPAALMLGLKIGGVRGRSSWGRMLVSDAFSVALMAGAVNSLKYTCRMPRPDGSNNKSFPSGHTATAFMAATMLHKEYGGRSPWYSIAGYSMATVTGVSRMLNNKHWLSDVLVGAGIGILSVELGYLFADLIFKDKGLTEFEQDFFYDRYCRPSFFGMEVSTEVVMGRYRPVSGVVAEFNAGVNLGIEGAWFMNPYVGFGGRTAVSSVPVTRRTAVSSVPVTLSIAESTDRLDSWSASAGAYFSYPITARWRTGGKVLAGYQYYESFSLDGYTLGGHGGPVFGVGTSMTFRANYNLDLRFQTTYYLQPPMACGSRQHLNTLTLGLSANIAF